MFGTDSNNVDTDGDGILDGAEVEQGLDPLNGIGFPTGIIASLPLLGKAQDIAVEGSIENSGQQTAFIATGSHGLAIVDVSQFSNPIVLSQLDLLGNATDVAVDLSRNLAFVAAGNVGLHFVDITDPLSPQLVRTVSQFGAIDRVEFVDNTVIAGGRTLSMLNPTTGDRLDELSLSPTASHVTDIASEGLTLFAVTEDDQLHSVDLSSGDLVLQDSIDIPVPPVRVLKPEDMRLFVANGVASIANGLENQTIAPTRPLERGGYVTYDVSDSSNLAFISNIDTPEVQAGNLKTVLNGSGLALVAGGFRGLQIHGGSDPEITYDLITEIPTPGTARSVAIAGGIAFVADDDAGLQVINYLPFDNLGQAPTVSIETTAIDVDPIAAGIQVEEGTSIPLIAIILDDVQMRNAELLVNGDVIRNDVSFPFDFFVPVPLIADAGDTLRIQVRATDTGGNATLSDPLLFSVIPDSTAPSITATNPEDGRTISQAQRTLRVAFSEAMAPNTLTANHIQLIDVSNPGTPVTPIDTEIRADDHVVEFTFNQLAVGDYELRIDNSAVTDRAGNGLGVGETIRTFSVVVADAIWNNQAGGFWDDPLNWLDAKLPETGDTVFISTAPGLPVIHRTGTSTFSSLQIDGELEITAGIIDASAILVLDGQLTLNGGTIRNALLDVSSTGTVNLEDNSALDNVILSADVTMENGTFVTIFNGLTLLDHTITLDSTGFDTTLHFDGGDQTLDGTGEILFTGGSNQFDHTLSVDFGDTLTIGPDITVRGTHGQLAPEQNAALINQGTILADQPGVFQLLGTYTNEGLIDVQSGRLDLFGTWSNAGTLRASGGQLFLDGTFPTPTVGGLLEDTGGDIIITGTVTNTGNTFLFNDSTGNLLLQSGRITGGTLQTTDSAQAQVTGSSIFDGVTLDTDVLLPNGAFVTVFNGLTLLDHSITLDSTGSDTTLHFEGSDQTLAGTGEILFTGGLNQFDHSLTVDFGDTLTIGPDITVRGTHANLTPENTAQIINQGRIVTDAAGQFTIIRLTNEGTIDAEQSDITFLSSLTNSGTIIARVGRLVTVNGDLTQNASGIFESELAGTLTQDFGRFDINGTANILGTFNAVVDGGFTPNLNDSFQVLTFDSRNGTQFDTINGLDLGGGLVLDPQYSDTDLTLVVVNAQNSQTASNLTGTILSSFATEMVQATPVVQEETRGEDNDRLIIEELLPQPSGTARLLNPTIEPGTQRLLNGEKDNLPQHSLNLGPETSETFQPSVFFQGKKSQTASFNTQPTQSDDQFVSLNPAAPVWLQDFLGDSPVA